MATRQEWRHLINVLTFLVWMSYRRCTESLICLLLARVSTIKTCRQPRDLTGWM